jgi:hypothetical protein
MRVIIVWSWSYSFGIFVPLLFPWKKIIILLNKKALDSLNVVAFHKCCYNISNKKHVFVINVVTTFPVNVVAFKV